MPMPVMQTVKHYSKTI